MPSPRRRSRERRSRSGSPQRRGQRRSRSRSPRRRSRSRSPKRRSPRRSRTHSPYRRPVKRSRSRSRNRRSFSPRRRSSPSPRGRPIKGRSPSPRGRRGALSPRGGLSRRRSPKGRPQVQRSPRRSPPKRSSHNDHDDRWQSPPSASGSRKKRRSASPHERNSPEPYSNIHQKSEFISGITVVTPIRRLMLSDRFETDEQKQQGEIVIEDNVVIAIQRGPHVRHASPIEINREFDSNHVVILRRKDEGSVPIFDREEIKIFGFDSILDENVYEERRIISVVPSTNTAPSKRHHSPEIIRKIQPQTQVKLNFRPDPRYEPLIKLHGSNESDQEKVRIKRVQKNPNDLRHSLSSKRVHDEGEEDDDDGFDARKKIEAKRKGPVSNKGDSEQVFNRLGDRSRERRRDRSKERHSDRRGPSGNRDSSRDRPDRRDREDKNKLPDFKNRPDRFQYEEWKENPEMIPRNPSYFEHDNREGERGFRGRGRGFRGRGPPRGRGRGFRGEGRGFRGEGRGFRGSGRGYSSSGRERESTWKHDLFDKLKEEEEEKPSSTTKN